VISGGKVQYSENDTRAVTGKWYWADTSEKVSLNKDSYDVIFVPDDTEHFCMVKTKLSVNVVKEQIFEKLKLTVKESPKASAIQLGSNIGQSVLSGGQVISGGNAVSGKWYWKDSSVVPALSDSDSALYEAVFIPDDTDTYLNATCGLSVTVIEEKQEEAAGKLIIKVVEKPIVSSITMGNSLGQAIISGGLVKTEDDTTAIKGKWYWIDSSAIPALSDSNTTEFAAIFIPDDTDTYITVGCGLTVTVNEQVLPGEKQDVKILEKPNVTDVRIGNNLGQSIIAGGKVVSSGNDTVEGKWYWEDFSIILDSVEAENTYKAIFVPADTENYMGTECLLTVAVIAEKEKSISTALVSVADVTWYRGIDKQPVCVQYGEEILKEGEDYELIYTNNYTSAGETVGVKAYGKGIYTGVAETSYKINWVENCIKNSDTDVVLNLMAGQDYSLPEYAKKKGEKTYKLLYANPAMKKIAQMSPKGIVKAKKTAGVSVITFTREGVEYKLTVNVFTPEKWGRRLEITSGNTGDIGFDFCGLKPVIELKGKGSQYLTVSEGGFLTVGEGVDKKKNAKIIIKYGKKKYAVAVSVLPLAR